MAQFRFLRQYRYNKLRTDGFTRAEAQVMSRFLFKQPYIQLMRQDRREFINGLIAEGASGTTMRNRLNMLYQINGWKDAYAMMRDYRKRVIDIGAYTPPIRKRKDFSKGDVAAQKRRRRERTKTPKVGEVIFNEQTGRFEPRYY